MIDQTGARLGVPLAAVMMAMAAVSLNAMDRDAPVGGDQRPQAEPTSLCSAHPTKSAAPVEAVLGEPVTVTTHVKALCGGVQHYDHIAMVLDGSETMSYNASRDMKMAAETLVRSLQLEDQRAKKVGVVEFGASTRVLCRPTNDERRVLNCVNRVNRRGAADMAAGISEGTKMLKAARAQVDPEFLAEVMVVFSNGRVDDDCRSAVSARHQAGNSGVLVIAVCASRDRNDRCMRQVASGSRYYFESGDHAGLLYVLERVLHRHYRITPRHLAVRDALSHHVYYDPDSAVPTPSTPVSSSRIAWETWYLPTDGVTFTHRVVPIATGEIPTSREASGVMQDSMGRTVEIDFEIPIITVREPTMTPTPTPSPTATPTPPPTPTATPTPEPVYLPRVVRFDYDRLGVELLLAEDRYRRLVEREVMRVPVG